MINLCSVKQLGSCYLNKAVIDYPGITSSDAVKTSTPFVNLFTPFKQLPLT